MLELYAFDTLLPVVDPSKARHTLRRALSLAEARALGHVAFLSCLFVNARMEDSSGALVRLTWADGVTADAVVLSPEALAHLAEKYQVLADALLEAGAARPLEPESLLWAFLQRSLADSLVVASRSRLTLHESE